MAVISTGALLIAVLPMAVSVHWVGRRIIDVEVWVADLDSNVPIEGTQVELLDVETMFESDTVRLAERIKTAADESTAAGMTDQHGRARLTHLFHAAGTKGLLGETGYIDTGATCLRISAPGHSQVIMPLNGHSTRPREIHDLKPIVVQVYLQAAAPLANE